MVQDDRANTSPQTNNRELRLLFMILDLMTYPGWMLIFDVLYIKFTNWSIFFVITFFHAILIIEFLFSKKTYGVQYKY